MSQRDAFGLKSAFFQKGKKENLSRFPSSKRGIKQSPGQLRNYALPNYLLLDVLFFIHFLLFENGCGWFPESCGTAGSIHTHFCTLPFLREAQGQRVSRGVTSIYSHNAREGGKGEVRIQKDRKWERE